MIKETKFNPAPLIEHMKSVPYELVHTALYNGVALYDGFSPEQPESEQDYYDRRVYQHYIATGKFPHTNEEAMARTLHDHAMKHQLANFVKAHNYLKTVGVMGGHGLSRTDVMYRQIVFLSKQLTEAGFLMISGGGPGAMEATHLGAWLAHAACCASKLHVPKRVRQVVRPVLSGPSGLITRRMPGSG